MANSQANLEVNERNGAGKKLLKFLCYLPIVLLGIIGSVIVIDMWHIAGVGRTRVTNTKRHDGFDPNLGHTPGSGPAKASP
jgi:hypothetical protein